MILRNFLFLPLVFSSFHSATSSAQTQETCFLNNQLFSPLILSNTNTLSIEADNSVVKNKDIYELSGDVSLISNEYGLRADSINLDIGRETLLADRNVNFNDSNISVISNKANLKKIADKQYYDFNGASYLFSGSKINGSADKISGQKGLLNLNNGSYSLCPLGNKTWEIKAKKISLNSQKNIGEASDLRLEVMGIPLFYSPTYEWVLKGRGSGFLAPSFGSYDDPQSDNESGLKTSIPYYFNIAADKDFLLDFNYLSTRGLLLNGEYRQLLYNENNEKNGDMKSIVNYLYRDDVTKKDRWYLENKVLFNPSRKSNINIQTKRASDRYFFKDIKHENTSKESLLTFIDYSLYEPKNNFNLNLYSETEQLINSGTPSYNRSFDAYVSKDFSINNADVNSNINFTNFNNADKNKTTGNRVHFESEYSKRVFNEKLTLTPSIKLLKTAYYLDGNPNINRTLYQASVNSQIPLEREIKILNKNLVQTLVPQLSYNYISKVNQSNIPSFDSELIDSDFESIISGKKFTGIDRISNDNSFNLGVSSDFINDDTGSTYVSFAIAQKFRLNKTELGADGNFNNVKKQSNLTSSINFDIDSLNFVSNFEIDPNNFSVPKTQSILRYNPSNRNVLNLMHERNTEVETAEISLVKKITSNIHLFGKFNKNLTDSITNKSIIGASYESCCWAFRFGHEKDYLGGNDWDHKVNLELVLKGLTSSSPSYKTKLNEEIPNYLSNLDDF